MTESKEDPLPVGQPLKPSGGHHGQCTHRARNTGLGAVKGPHRAEVHLQSTAGRHTGYPGRHARWAGWYTHRVSLSGMPGRLSAQRIPLFSRSSAGCLRRGSLSLLPHAGRLSAQSSVGIPTVCRQAVCAEQCRCTPCACRHAVCAEQCRCTPR